MTSTPRVITQGQFSVLVCVVVLSAVVPTAMAQRILARHPVLEAEIDTQAAVPTVPDVGSLHGDVELYAGGPGDDDEVPAHRRVHPPGASGGRMRPPTPSSRRFWTCTAWTAVRTWTQLGPPSPCASVACRGLRLTRRHRAGPPAGRLKGSGQPSPATPRPGPSPACLRASCSRPVAPTPSARCASDTGGRTATPQRR